MKIKKSIRFTNKVSFVQGEDRRKDQKKRREKKKGKKAHAVNLMKQNRSRMTRKKKLNF